MLLADYLAPREPQAYAAEVEEHVDADVAAPAQAVEECVVAHAAHVEEHHHEHGGAHQPAPLAAEAAVVV